MAKLRTFDIAVGTGANPIAVDPTATSDGGVAAQNGDILIVVSLSDNFEAVLAADGTGWTPGPGDAKIGNHVAASWTGVYGSVSGFDFSATGGGAEDLKALLIVIDPDGATLDDLIADVYMPPGAGADVTPSLAAVGDPSFYVAVFTNDSAFSVDTPPSGMTACGFDGSSSTTIAGYYEENPQDDPIVREIVFSGTDDTINFGFLLDLSAGGDITAPTLSNASASATGSTTASGSVDTDEPCTVDFVLTPYVNQPTGTQIKAGQDHTGAAAVATSQEIAAAPGAVPTTFAGIPQGTQGLYMHAVPTDAADNEGAVITAGPFDMPQVVSVQLGNPAGLHVTAGALAIAVDRTLAGVVTQNGVGVVADVYLLNRRTAAAVQTASDGDGSYSFADVPPGTYAVLAIADQQTKAYAEVTVT